MLRRELQAIVEHEMDQTCQVAVLLAAGHSLSKTRDVLGLTQVEAQMALERIRRVTGKWLGEQN